MDAVQTKNVNTETQVLSHQNSEWIFSSTENTFTFFLLLYIRQEKRDAIISKLELHI